MITSLRALSKSKFGAFILLAFIGALGASFALADIQGVAGGGQIGMGRDTLAKVGGLEISDRDMSSAMERQLTLVRQQQPNADYSAIAKDFDPLLEQLIQERALEAFAADHGFELSKRLVDAEIARIPATRGLDGKFSEANYNQFLSQQRLTDRELRRLLGAGVTQKLLLTPVAANARAAVGYVTPFASMLLEQREGEVALVATDPFRAGLKPSETDLASYYQAKKARYTVPEQRVLKLAPIGGDQVAGVAVSEKEIADYYAANQTVYGGKDIRVITQAVVPTEASAKAIAAAVRQGTPFADAVKPAGLGAADISVGPQDRKAFTDLAGEQVAAAAFAATEGAIVGPIKSDLGWHVLKVENIQAEAGRSLASVRGEIGAKLLADKRKEALIDLVTKAEEEIADGSSFNEVAAAHKLAVTTTPPVTAAGKARGDAAYRFPAAFAAALPAGFDLQDGDDPVIETLPNDQGYVLVAVDRIVPAAPAPLAEIRDQVASDWIGDRAAARAKAVAQAIAAKVAKGVPMAAAVAEAGVPLPRPETLKMRRIQLSQVQGEVPAPLRILFSLAEGKSRMVAAPGNRGFFIVRASKIVPGNAISQPGLIAATQREFQQALGSEYAEQFLAAVAADQGVKRSAEHIAASKRRITGPGN